MASKEELDRCWDIADIANGNEALDCMHEARLEAQAAASKSKE